jgi:kumamolisin
MKTRGLRLPPFFWPRFWLTLELATGLAGALYSAAAAAASAPYPRASTPAPLDLGSAQAISGNQLISVSVALPLRDTAAAQALLEATYTPGSPQYRKFLTSQQFSAQFGPTDATVAQVTKRLQSAGLQVTRASSTVLKVSGSMSAVEAAFSVSLHAYEVPSSAGVPGYRYRAPASAPQVASDIASSVQAVLGLDTRPRFRPHIRHSSSAIKIKSTQLSSSVPNTPDMPGLWTVTDFVDYYDVGPLYKEGIEGKHRTIGIVTLAAFTPSDAFAYWNSLGLTVSSKRIKIVAIDGGSGPPSDASGSDETTLDVEQSGGLAPAANVIVYEAPNTEQGFVDAFAAAFDSNIADTVSTSWGQWEYLDDTSTAVDPVTHRNVNALKAFNDLFTQAALQGQSMYAAAGDAGAYDANDSQSIYPLTDFSKTLSVDSPASQPFLTAAGGTTLPGLQSFTLNDGSTLSLTLPTEQAWGWDYLQQLCVLLGFPDLVECGILPVGGGGGVSVFTPRPFYQYFVPGVINSAGGQALVDRTRNPPQLIFKLPANFVGRNVPDISLNADPDTGYVIWYTSDQNGFEIEQFIGGTSFVAPQLNGITALYDQGLGYRLGLLNNDLYNLVRFGVAYGGRNAPLRDITTGDNWFYTGERGYDQATGVGVPDVTNLFKALQSPFL